MQVSQERFAVQVGTDFVEVKLLPKDCQGSAECMSREVRLVFPSGDAVSAETDANGVARLRPEARTLLANAEARAATVSAGGDSKRIDIAPLIEGAKHANADEWAQQQERSAAARAAADGAVHFMGQIYHDKNPNPLVDSCTPTGAEQCFDGIDNDCDGRYDNVGCGYSSGVLQWTVTWQGPADLDLRVVGPNGEGVRSDDPLAVQAKLRYDRDCHGMMSGAADCPEGNVENVYVRPSEVPLSGTYQAMVEVRDAPQDQQPVKARFSGRVGAKTWYTDIVLAPFPGASYEVAFPIGADSDNDSIVDEHDACPDVPGCWFDDLAVRGCPDQDGDDVPDSLDACPTQAGVNRKNPEYHGCPLVYGEARVTNQGIQILKRIEFATGKADLREESKALIKDVASAILAHPDSLTRLSIDGHTDEVGTEMKNIGLSFQRAQSVRKELIEDGVPKDMLEIRGFGETKPIADNDGPEGRQKNRRVEFVVLRPAPRTAQCW